MEARTLRAMALSVEQHAQILAELFAAEGRRADVLRRHGLDEAAWKAEDAEWQARLSEALAQPGDGVDRALSDHAAAYSAAQRSIAEPVGLEAFAAVTRLLRARGDLGAALAEVGITLQAYVAGSAHWSGRIAVDPEIAARFEACLRREARERGG